MMQPILLADEQLTFNKHAADEVFKVVSDLNRFGEWFPEVKSIHALDDTPADTVGKRYLEQVAIPEAGVVPVTIQVVAVESNRSLTTEGDLQPLLPRMRIVVTPVSKQSCTVRWRMWSRSEDEEFRTTHGPVFTEILGDRAQRALPALAALLSGAEIEAN